MVSRIDCLLRLATGVPTTISCASVQRDSAMENRQQGAEERDSMAPSQVPCRAPEINRQVGNQSLQWRGHGVQVHGSRQ